MPILSFTSFGLTFFTRLPKTAWHVVILLCPMPDNFSNIKQEPDRNKEDFGRELKRKFRYRLDKYPDISIREGNGRNLD